MSIAEILPAVQLLSRQEKYRLAQILLDDLARGEEVFPAGQVFPIYTPEYAPGAATQLAHVLGQVEEADHEHG